VKSRDTVDQAAAVADVSDDSDDEPIVKKLMVSC